MEQERVHDGDVGKVASYERAMGRGETLPPAFVIVLEGELILDDGWHRCAAAALVGHATISAVVFNVRSCQEADTVSTLLIDLEDRGLPRQARVRFVAVLLHAKTPVSA
jgi:hypothetical protein